MATNTVLSTTPDWVTVTPCKLRCYNQPSQLRESLTYLGESLGGIERGEEGEGDPASEYSPADQDQVDDVLHLHVDLVSD